MKTLTVTEARRRFGEFLKAAQQEPVLVRWKNGTKVVAVSAERYRRMAGITSFEPEPVKLLRKKKQKSS